MSNVRNPVVSVIVPARNEEACLAICLESLVAQRGIEFEIIVVDDASDDRTAEIARSFAVACAGAALQGSHPPRLSPDGTEVRPDGSTTGKGTSSTRADLGVTPETNGTAGSRALPVRGGQNISKDCLAVMVIPAPPLPENWTGKNNAMCAGAKIAHTKAKWLLFTDADTVHKPGSLARAVAEAEEQRAALLSYSPEQEVRTFWEKAVMPVIFAELAATYPPKKVNDPASPIAAANGQYLLISREAYDAVGGHAKIAGDLLEDVAMARLVKSTGRRIFFRYGGDVVRTRMYRTWAQMKEGWTKNLALLFPHPIRMTARYSFESFQLFLLAITLIDILLFGPLEIRSQSVLLPHSPIPDRYVPLFKWWLPVCVVVLLGRLALFSVRRVLKANFQLKLFLISMSGPAVFAYLLLRSVTARRNGAVRWKSRTYGNVRTGTVMHKSPPTRSAM